MTAPHSAGDCYAERRLQDVRVGIIARLEAISAYPPKNAIDEAGYEAAVNELGRALYWIDNGVSPYKGGDA